MSRIEEALKKAANRRRSSIEAIMPVEPVKSEKVAQKPLKSDKKPFTSLLEIPPLKVEHLLLVTAKEEKTYIVEEYDKLRSTIIALTRGDKFLNTLLVTSTVSEEGKSMTALNLAISLAKEHDYTVLLVDTDLRKPAIHSYLDIKPEVGLVHCLRDGLPIEKALIKTGIGKLVVLPAGEAIKDPLDMLASRRMKNIIDELKERYPERYVIFDTPPALPFADAHVLADMVDSTLFVVREGKTIKEDLKKTLEDFKEHHLLGVVYNDAHMFLKNRNYYYYY